MTGSCRARQPVLRNASRSITGGETFSQGRSWLDSASVGDVHSLPVTHLSLRDAGNEAKLTAWAAAVGVVDAPVPRRGISEALRFFRRHMPTLSPAMAVSFLRATDLSRPVRGVRVMPGEVLIGYRSASESQFKLFFTRPGRSVWNAGLNPSGRRYVRFRVRVPFEALESYAGPAKDTWSMPGREYLASGGATQLIVSESYRRLLVVEDSSARA